MANGLTFEILNIILQILQNTPVRILIEDSLCKIFKEIGSKLTEKSPKIMRSRLIIFNLTASIGPCCWLFRYLLNDGYLYHILVLYVYNFFFFLNMIS